jgi:predicted TIM-barrel fold metal-dependent hydrolase
MVIDIHCHPPRRGNGSVERMIELARRCGIDKLCMLGRVGEHGYDPSIESIRASNSETLADVRAHPDALIGMAYLNPRHPSSFLEEEAQRCIVEGPMRGIKLWVAVNARDPAMDPVMALAERLAVPVLHHAWYKTVSHAFNESTPADIANLARRFPRVHIIMAHLSGCNYRGVADVRDCPNVYMDTSGSQPEAGIVEYAVKALGANRLVFGSDVTGRDFSCQLGRILGADLTAQEREQILGGNAARLLRLEGKA